MILEVRCSQLRIMQVDLHNSLIFNNLIYFTSQPVWWVIFAEDF